MLAIEEARAKHFQMRLREVQSGAKHAESVTVALLQILVEEKFFL